MRFADVWTTATLVSTRDVTHDIREFVLKLDEPPATPPQPGAHIRIQLEKDGHQLQRCYSLVGLMRNGTCRIAVRRAPDSRGGSRAMWKLEAGARLRITQPTCLLEMDWTRNSYCLIAAGVGITPMISIAERLLERGAQLTLHYAVRSASDAAYLDDLRELLGDRLRVYESAESNRLDLNETFAGLRQGALTIMCGPMRMLDTAKRIWRDQGRSHDDLRYETFGSSGLLPTSPFRVRTLQGGDIAVREDQSMLDALNEAGFDVISDCERGECGVCAINVADIEGSLDHRDVFFSDHEKQQGQKICPCVSRAVGTVTVDTLYRAEA